MGTCLSYVNCDKDTTNLAQRNISEISDPFPDYPEEPSPQAPSLVSDQGFTNDESSVELIELNHFKRPMLRRSLTTYYMSQPQPISLNSPQSKFRKTISSPKKKGSFLLKAKERFKRQMTLTTQEPKDEYNNDNKLTQGALTERCFKSTDFNYLVKVNGDWDLEVN